MGEGFLAVKGFATFQHYRDRNPPWIKLYGTLLSDAAFLQLPEAAQAQLVKLWILASQLGHPLPNNPKLLAGKIGTVGRFHLASIIDAGFLIPCNHSASSGIADCSDDASKPASRPLARLLAKPVSRARARRADARSRESTEIENRTTSSSSEKPLDESESKVTWLSPVCVVWEARNGAGSFAGVAGRVAKAVAPLRTAGHEMATVAERLDVYLNATESRYWSIEKFASTFGQWEKKSPVDANGFLTPEAYARLSHE